MQVICPINNHKKRDTLKPSLESREERGVAKWQKKNQIKGTEGLNHKWGKRRPNQRKGKRSNNITHKYSNPEKIRRYKGVMGNPNSKRKYYTKGDNLKEGRGEESKGTEEKNRKEKFPQPDHFRSSITRGRACSMRRNPDRKGTVKGSSGREKGKKGGGVRLKRHRRGDKERVKPSEWPPRKGKEEANEFRRLKWYQA